MRLLAVFISLSVLLVGECTYEQYTLLPMNSEMCTKPKSLLPRRSFEVFKQMSFTTGTFSPNVTLVHYVCEARIQPMGQLITHEYPKRGTVAFWYIRYKIEMSTSCDDYLTIDYSPTKDSPKFSRNYTCHSVYPQIEETHYRLMSIYWYTKDGSMNSQSTLNVQIVSYMRFIGDFPLMQRKSLCEGQSGFWCGNVTDVCLSEPMRCDGVDDCFDGGTDELSCPAPRNITGDETFDTHTHSGWTVNLPWIALGILPVILLFALVRICSQKRQLDVSEDYKMSSSDDDGLEDNDGDEARNGPMTSSWLPGRSLRNSRLGGGSTLRASGECESSEDDDTETEDEEYKPSSLGSIGDITGAGESIPLSCPRTDSGRVKGNGGGVVILEMREDPLTHTMTSSIASLQSTGLPVSATRISQNSDRGSGYEDPDEDLALCQKGIAPYNPSSINKRSGSQNSCNGSPPPPVPPLGSRPSLHHDSHTPSSSTPHTSAPSPPVTSTSRSRHQSGAAGSATANNNGSATVLVSAEINNPIYGRTPYTNNHSSSKSEGDSLPPPPPSYIEAVTDPCSKVKVDEGTKLLQHSAPSTKSHLSSNSDVVYSDIVDPKASSSNSDKRGHKKSDAKAASSTNGETEPLMTSVNDARKSADEPDYDRDYIVV